MTPRRSTARARKMAFKREMVAEIARLQQMAARSLAELGIGRERRAPGPAAGALAEARCAHEAGRRWPARETSSLRRGIRNDRD
jgi:hypothetical protein